MRNLNSSDDPYDQYDYSPNELAELSMRNPSLYRQVVESNLQEDDSVEDWENRNLERMKNYFKHKN